MLPSPTRPQGTAPRTSVVTILTPAERSRVEAAGQGLFTSIHRESVDDVVRDVRAARANAVVVSVTYCDRTSSERVASMVREFPGVPTVALLSELGPQTPQTLMTLGTGGVRRLIDVRNASGWGALRSALTSECGNGVQRLALARIGADLAGATRDCRQFFETLFLSEPRVCTVRSLAVQLGVLPSTLMSRFFRAGLPAPKRYLAMARLVRAAHLFENRGFSVANVANHLEYSSPQSFGRHVRAMVNVSAQEFRERYSGEAMLDRFREELILPHLTRLARLRPLTFAPATLARLQRARAS